MRITFEGSTALELIQQMQQFITDTGSVIVPATVGTIQSGVQITGATHPPVPPVVATSDVEPPPNANPPALDVNGFPWDERIHSSSKATNKDGSWRYKKGVEKTTIQVIEAELSQRLNAAPAAPVPTPAAPPPPAATTGFTETPAVAPAAPVPTPAAPPPAAAPAPTVAPAAPSAVTAATIVKVISTNKLDVPTVVLPVLTAHGLSALPEIFQPQNAGMLPSIYASLGGQ